MAIVTLSILLKNISTKIMSHVLLFVLMEHMHLLFIVNYVIKFVQLVLELLEIVQNALMDCIC